MEKRRRGRPAKTEDDRASINFTMRLRPPLFEQLQREAEKEGRSISAQAERRLMFCETHLTRVVAAAVSAAEHNAKQRKASESAVEDACRRAAHLAVEIAFNRISGPTDAEVERLAGAARQGDLNARLEDDLAPVEAAEFEAGEFPPK